ncbi:MAG: GPW/gp25 family protein [Nitrospinota bacterium]|nr:GPW/gp25 family protein [Nitrospinota bacterium]
MYIGFPFSINGRGRTNSAGYSKHIVQLIEQVLFTGQEERVNRPDFGCGINRLLFEGNSPELATATQFLSQGALQQWLGDYILVESVIVKNENSTLYITVNYLERDSGQRNVAEFSREA